MHPVVVEQLPNGLSLISGGSRTAVQLDRPWQGQIAIDPRSCPFETRPQTEIGRFAGNSTWRLLANPFTPFQSHRLVIPDQCWPIEQLRTLGGELGILDAMTAATTLLANKAGASLLTVHVGASAGQRLGHLHYHLIGLPDSDTETRARDEVLEYCRSTPNVVWEDDNFRVVVAGLRAGQAFILPATLADLATGESRRALAALLARLIGLYAEKFRSVQGLPPDYMAGLSLDGPVLRYASLIPILNQWGFTEYFGLLDSAPLVLPWPHSATLAHLRA